MNTQRLKVIGIIILFSLFIIVTGIYDFLAINRPAAGANILVVEGWLWKSKAMKEAAEIYRQGNYDWLVTVGEPDEGEQKSTNARKSTAELAALRLQEYAIDGWKITQLPVPEVEAHQTYTCALTVRKWLNEKNLKPTAINVFSLGTHARKSLVLFEKALGQSVKVGVYAGTEDTFVPERWLTTSRGIYVVTRKAMGYLYAVLWPLPNQG
ncbi:MAG: YdcF family protein [Gammaproteobacteria bacterium]|nr:YdcF family protein [Gammaproteobacteria bacterium]